MRETNRGRRTIRWRLHLRSSPDVVFAMLNTAEGRRRFWAASAEEPVPGRIQFEFSGGERWISEIVERTEPTRFALTYLRGSLASFELTPDDRGGTDLQLTESEVSPPDWEENHAGWVSVLLALKAAADFDVDLRNGDPKRSWAHGYVDV